MSDVNHHPFTPPADMPVGDPKVIQVIQQFLMMAQRGQIVSVAIGALLNDGNTAKGLAVLGSDGALAALVGSLESVKMDVLTGMAQRQRQQQTMPILRPMGR
jgi:hypothetical protein